MPKVQTEQEILGDEWEIDSPDLHNGSITTLSMTEEEKAEAQKKEQDPNPLGFG
jgi:hypothetical protein